MLIPYLHSNHKPSFVHFLLIERKYQERFSPSQHYKLFRLQYAIQSAKGLVRKFHSSDAVTHRFNSAPVCTNIKTQTTFNHVKWVLCYFCAKGCTILPHLHHVATAHLSSSLLSSLCSVKLSPANALAFENRPWRCVCSQWLFNLLACLGRTEQTGIAVGCI